MTFFLTADAWKLFTLNVSPLLLVAFIPTEHYTHVHLAAASLLAAAPLMLWMYFAGTELQKLAASYERLGLGFFTFNLIFAFLYLLSFCMLLAVVFDRGRIGPEFGVYLGIAIPAQLYAIFALYHAVFFVSKCLTILELRRPVHFRDAARTFFLLWFFPIGVWYIQPRMKLIFSQPK